MRVRATLRLRNDALLTARESLRLTQIQVAKGAGVPVYVLSALERFKYDSADYEYLKELDGAQAVIVQHAKKVAMFLDLPLEDVLPSLCGVKIEDVTRVAEISPEQLTSLGMGSHTLALSMDPCETAANRELSEVLDDILSSLPLRQACAFRQRRGIGCAHKTLDEIAKDLHVTRERVRQLDLRVVYHLGVGVNRRRLADAAGLEQPEETNVPKA